MHNVTGGTAIATQHFEYNSVKYFRDLVENIEMCSFGEKKDPVGTKSHLEVAGNVQRKYLEGKVEKIPSVSIEWEKTSKADVGLNVGLTVFEINAKLGVNYSYEAAKSANLKLLKFFINGDPLMRMLNNDADKARNSLADEGNDGRIVSTIWIMLTGELASHFNSVGSISAEASDLNLNITPSGGVAGSQTITLSPATTFAYAYHKVKKWNNGKIEEVEGDYYGLS